MNLSKRAMTDTTYKVINYIMHENGEDTRLSVSSADWLAESSTCSKINNNTPLYSLVTLP